MGAAQRAVRGLVAVLGCTGLGVLLWAAVAPDEERRKEMAKEHPKSSPEQRTERQQQNAIVMAAIKQAAETNENVARKEWPWSK
ncbi:distal membrane-arm assembly complex protein 1 isoform X1 [Sceloporus undulatus]|uniref:distal membrane-arm assembly complex protein 1 isoform X1 n=1 Tax=Sceloporus undulatus TaxID=8520 RepID=UPI001C4CEC32|nr:distal membrane-arm assembly complex protein 1 isoform X1 [Sceloporus undulatus]